MGFVNRFLALSFVCLVLVGLFVISVKSAEVYAVSKPDVPEFTVKLVDYSYDVPPSTTTTVDQYTGEKITTTTSGHHIEDKRIEITVKNQPFTPYTDANGNKCNLYYAIEYKGYYGDAWYLWCLELEQTKSQYTTSPLIHSLDNYAAGSKLDFRVEARIGYKVDYYNPFMPDRIVSDVSSGWSKVQTFIVPDVSSSLSPSQNVTQPTNPFVTSGNNQPQWPNQTQPPSFIFNPFFLLGIIALLLCVIIVLVILFLIRQTKTSTNIDNNSPQTDDSSGVLQNAMRKVLLIS